MSSLQPSVTMTWVMTFWLPERGDDPRETLKTQAFIATPWLTMFLVFT
jgi:hypothetical protein